MTKVVYNNCYGGFGLNNKAKVLYKERGGTFDFKGWMSDMDRTDPILVQLVEEGVASGTFADLSVKDIPKGTLYRIDEYDGNESVKTIDDYEWSVA